jgi:hypothetical protein
MASMLKKEGPKIMIFVLHGNRDEFAWRKLRRSVTKVVSENDIEVMRSKESLAKRLTQVACRQAIVLFITTDPQDLVYFLPMIHLLRKAQVLLVIPNPDQETVRIGYKLEPRFLSTEDETFIEVRAILSHMVGEGKNRGHLSTQKTFCHDFFLANEALAHHY